MKKTVATGRQSFEDIIKENLFYVDKTSFIKEWWESGDGVTLITRPRRFGKTLNMEMLECFFSNRYADSISVRYLPVSTICFLPENALWKKLNASSAKK